jgi:hypothetical protein
MNGNLEDVLVLSAVKGEVGLCPGSTPASRRVSTSSDSFLATADRNASWGLEDGSSKSLPMRLRPPSFWLCGGIRYCVIFLDLVLPFR